MNTALMDEMKMTHLRNIALGLSALLLSCNNDLAQLIVTVDVSAGIPCDVDELVIRAENDGRVVMRQAVAVDGNLPISATVVTDGADTVDIWVTGLVGGVENLQVRSRVTIPDKTTVHLPVTLSRDCSVATPCVVDGAALGAFVSIPTPVGVADCSAECVPADPPVEDCATPADDNCDGQVNEGCAVSVERYTYEDVTPFETFVDACTTPGALRAVVLENTNEMEAGPDPLMSEMAIAEFDFAFYGMDVTSLWIGDNGYVALSDAAPGSIEPVQPGALDFAGVPRLAALPFWERLTTRDDGVCVTLSDAAARRRLIVTWKDVCFAPCGESDHLNFSVVFEEESDRVLFLYGEMQAGDGSRALGSGAAVGVTGPLAPGERPCDASECGSDGLCMSGASMGMPCGFTQVFANMAQSEGLVNLEFTPVSAE